MPKLLPPGVDLIKLLSIAKNVVTICVYVKNFRFMDELGPKTIKNKLEK
jgi:hypothetical protein